MGNTIQEKLYKELQLQQSKSKDYKAWGEVEVVKVALKSGDEIVLYQTGQSINEIQVFKSDNCPDKAISDIFANKKKVNVILFTKQTNATKVINQKPKEVPPILDDQAQLLGVSIRLVEPTNYLKGLSGRYSTLLNDGTTICIGNTMEDAFVAAFLVEKTCKAYVESQPVGGAKPINRLEAWLMHQFYMLKYSKESEKNK